MKLQLQNKSINVPDIIYLDQLVKLDLSKIETLTNSDLTTSTQSNDMLQWLLDFLKMMGVTERLTLTDLILLQKGEQLTTWFGTLFKDFQMSN